LAVLIPPRLGAGTTRLCAGIVSVAKPISIECQMANYSNSLYQQLEEETGVKTGQTLYCDLLLFKSGAVNGKEGAPFNFNYYLLINSIS